MRYGDGDQQKLDYAAQMITTLAYAILRQSDKVSLATFDEEVRALVPPSNSMAQIVRMTELLDELTPVHKTRMAECLVELTGRMKRREIVMIFSDFFTELDTLEPALQRMRYHHHEVVLFQVMHHDELAFDLEGSIRFVGLELPEELLSRPEELRRSYLEAFRVYETQFQEICQRNHIERIVVDTSRELSDVFADYLNRHSRLARSRV